MIETAIIAVFTAGGGTPANPLWRGVFYRCLKNLGYRVYCPHIENFCTTTCLKNPLILPYLFTESVFMVTPFWATSAEISLVVRIDRGILNI